MAATFRHESFLLELPFDVGLPRGFILHVKDDPDAPVTPGWEDFDLNRYLGLSGDPVPRHIPSTTLMFAVAPGPSIRPWRSAEKAWPGVFRWQRRSLSLPSRIATSAPVRVVRDVVAVRGLQKPVSVVQAVRLAPRPTTYDEDWRWAQLTAALDHLNDFLTAVMSVRRDPEVTPVGLRDVPPLVLGFGWNLNSDDSRSRVEWQAYLANDRLPLDHPPMTWEEADLASWISATKGHPLKDAGDFLLGAWSSAQRGRYTHAVAEAGTAVELLAAGSVRLVAPLRGYSADKLTNVLGGPFASLVKDHFAVLVGYGRDPATAPDALGVWWRDAYILRNQVVHRGFQPREPDTVKALEAAEGLVHDLGARFSNDQQLRQLLLPVPNEVWAAAQRHGSGPVPRSFENP